MVLLSVLLVALGVLFAAASVAGRRHDARMLRNGVALTASVALGVPGLLGLASQVTPVAGLVLGLLVLLLPLAIVVVGVGLVVNGVTMLRREGRSLGNQLSLLAGLGVFALPVAAVVLVVASGWVGLSIAVLLFFASAYASAALLSFAVYSVVYGRMRHDVRPAAVVVHGSGLVGGELTPLLRGRVERGLAVWRHEVSRGGRPLLVPSGGQGSDEQRPEAEAMAEHLRAAGVPDDALLPETSSRTTEENLARSRELLDERGVTGPLVLVTSDYHVLRTASLARRLGLDAQVVGSRTARYYVPSAFLREFVALLVEHRRVTAAALTPFVLLAVAIAVGGLTGLFDPPSGP